MSPSSKLYLLCLAHFEPQQMHHVRARLELRAPRLLHNPVGLPRYEHKDHQGRSSGHPQEATTPELRVVR